MKEDTKEKLMVVGLVGAGLYMLTRGEDEAAGGFGGGGGIPLLPGDTEDAAAGDTIINYILGGDDGDPFGGFGDDAEDDGSKKAMALLEKYESVIEPFRPPPGMAIMLEKTAAAGLKPTTGREWAAQQRELAAAREEAEKPSTIIEGVTKGFQDFWGMTGAERGIAAREASIESGKEYVAYKAEKTKKETGYKATALDTIFGFFTGKELGAEDLWAEARRAETSDVMSEISKSSVGRTAQFKASTPRAPSGVFADFRKQFTATHAKKMSSVKMSSLYDKSGRYTGYAEYGPSGHAKYGLDPSGSYTKAEVEAAIS